MLKISPTPWLIDKEYRQQIISDTPLLFENLICCSPDINLRSFEYWSENANAIVTAVNATYGQGINPESIELLKGVAEHVLNMVKLDSSISNSFPQLVKKASKALEKSKL